ncbi:hypothetical protein BDZ97DRAFT_1192732 [Flammula alnicola]|nr:hypothetical protein BDZ97DRAFT_1192732 [Flammula alnicola]
MYPVIDTANMSGETQAMMILISPQENKLAELTKQVQGLQVAYQKEKEEKDLLKKRCSDLESAIKRWQEETQQSKDADETAKLQVAAAQTAAGRTHLELNRANAKILEMETDMACRGVEYKAEIADYQSEIEAYRAEIKQLKGD